MTDPNLVDARALWWHEADVCHHTAGEQEWGECDCRTWAGWDLGSTGSGWFLDVDGVRYVTDRRLLIRADRLSNWPANDHLDDQDEPDVPWLYDMASTPIARAEALRLLAAPVTDEPVTARFDPVLLDPLTVAGYTVRPTTSPRGVHAVVDPAGMRVGLLMAQPTSAPATHHGDWYDDELDNELDDELDDGLDKAASARRGRHDRLCR